MQSQHPNHSFPYPNCISFALHRALIIPIRMSTCCVRCSSYVNQLHLEGTPASIEEFAQAYSQQL